MNKYPLCIISKSRADICTSHKLFEIYGIKYFYMVEPQDYENYINRFGKEKIINIEKNNTGIYYARNFCIEWAKSNGYNMHWQIDDNIKLLLYRPLNNIKMARTREKIKNPLKMLLDIENTASQYKNYGAGCITNDSFAFAKKRDIDINKMVYCFQLINNNIKTRFRPNISVDIDFSVQLLVEGYITMVFNKYSFRKPPSGSMAGGCNSSPDYKNNGRKTRNLQLCQMYPTWFKEYTKNNQSEIMPSRIWGIFSQKPIKRK